MQPIGTSSLDFNISEILAELPELQFPCSRYPNLFPTAQENRPAYSYAPAIHADRLEEDVPPRQFETNVAAHMLRVCCSTDLIPYPSYTISSATYNKETWTISFYRMQSDGYALLEIEFVLIPTYSQLIHVPPWRLLTWISLKNDKESLQRIAAKLVQDITPEVYNKPIHRKSPFILWEVSHYVNTLEHQIFY